MALLAMSSRARSLFISRLPSGQIWPRHGFSNKVCRHRHVAKAAIPDLPTEGYLAREIEAARLEKRPYRLDKSKLTPKERQILRLRSKAIPLVADSEPLDIVHEDDTFLVVSKPSFVKMHPRHRFEGGSLVNRTIGYLGYQPRILHRLDMVVFAKKREVCEPIMHQFMNGHVKKQYLCIVDGNPDCAEQHSFTVDAPIETADIKFARRVGHTKDDSKPASTIFTMLGKAPSLNMSLVLAAPQTGRTHQIRVHAVHSGFPIVGDDLYNPKEHAMYDSLQAVVNAAEDPDMQLYADGNPLRKGLKLHAWKISLINPLTEERVYFCAPPPEAFCRLLDWCDIPRP